jgi:hypothetical protein
VQRQPPLGTNGRELQRGNVIPFLGAGASLAPSPGGLPWRKGIGSLPSGRALAGHLATDASLPKKLGGELQLAAQYYTAVSGRRPLRSELREIFGGANGEGFPVRPIHDYLASIDTPLLIVTTNYDDLIERALTNAQREVEVIIHTTDSSRFGDNILWRRHGSIEPTIVPPNQIADVDLELGKRTVVYKMHGAVSDDQYVITEDDYVDFLARMGRNSAIPMAFTAPFEERHFLFLGYGLRDWNFRAVLGRVERDLRTERGKEVRSWAIDINPAELDRFLWERRGVDVYRMTIDEFVAGMRALDAEA